MNLFSWAKDYIKKNRSFFVFLFLLFVIRWSFIDHYRVPTGSMIPTIEIGDNIIVNKLAYRFKIPFTNSVLFEIATPKKGDIVVFQYPVDPSIDFVKRCVGVPGDELEIVDGILKVNGKEVFADGMDRIKLREELAKDQDIFYYYESLSDNKFKVQRIPLYFRPMYKKMTVPAGMYFMMGDNRDNSLDSRFWGFVPHSYIKGQAIRVLFSVSFGDYFIPDFKLTRIGKNIKNLSF